MSVMRALALVFAVVAGACAQSTPERTGALLFPVQRLLDAPAPSLTGVAWGRYVRIDGEERPTIAAVPAHGEPIAASPPMADSPGGRWSLQLPQALHDAEWVLVQPGIRAPDGGLAMLPPLFVAPRTTGPVVLLDGGDAATREGVSMVAMVSPVAPLDAHDVVGPPFAVPAGAVAEVGIGIHPMVWSGESAPVEFRIAVVEGGHDTIVARAVLDPMRHEQDRRWLDLRADLSAFAGRTVAIALRTVPADPARPGTSLPVWADPVVRAPRATAAPNVILISLDTLRAKSVSAYGSPRATTPHLDRMVGEAGAIFDFAYTTAPHTLPAHMSTFTGLFARGLSGVSPISALPTNVATLPERMRAAGYDTAAVTEDGFIIPRIGFERGFGSYRENTSPNLHEPLGQAAKTFRAAADWLGTRRDRPTFLFVHTYEVHFPYTPAPPYDTAFATPADFGDDQNAIELLRYEQEARHLDDELRAFLDAVDGYGLGTRTLVVVMADHGEEFHEHGQPYHGLQVYTEAIHVPLMMRLPGVVPPGLRVATPVSLVDVAPTILDLVGAAPLVGVDGVSLVPLLGNGALPERRRAVYSEAASSLAVMNIDLLSVQMAGIHCIYRTGKGTSECFDTALDPDERKPIVAADPRVDAAREEAVAYWSLRRAPTATTSPKDLLRDLQRDDDAERLQKLRSLGYVE